MRIPLFHRGHDPFPRPKDLPGIPPSEAARALDVLRRMTIIDVASVYTSAGLHGTRWQVWLDVTRRRLTLAEWATEWLAKHPAPTSPTSRADQMEGA